MVIPQQLTAGTTWQWDSEYANYPASTWTAVAHFQNAAHSFTVSASAVGTVHRFSETSANTAAFGVGLYRVRVRVTDGSSVYVAEDSWCAVEADPTKAGNIDHRSWARRTLEAIEAFLEGNATTAQQAITIAGRSISRWSLPELVGWRDQLRAEVRAEEQGDRAGLGRDIKVRVSRA